MNVSKNLDGACAKTDKGREEIATRSHGQAHHLRTVLIPLDGKTPLRELIHRCKAIPDFPDDVRQLLEGGFIAELHGGKPATAADATQSMVAAKRTELIHITPTARPACAGGRRTTGQGW